jgi:hypothetical protein
MATVSCVGTNDLVKVNLNNDVLDLRNSNIHYLDFDKSDRIFPNHDFVQPMKLVTDGNGGVFVWDMGFGKVFKVLPDTLIMVGNMGVGPGEYAAINDIDYDLSKQELIIHDIQLKKFIYFNNDLQLVRETPMSLYLDQFQRLEDGSFAFYGFGENYIDGKLNMKNFVILDSTLSFIKFSAIDFIETLDDMELGKHHFFEVDDELFLVNPFDEMVIVLDKNTYSIKRNIHLRIAADKDLARLKRIRRIEKLFEFVYGDDALAKGLPFNIYYSQNYLLFQFMNSGKRGFGLVDWKTKDTKLFRFKGDPKFYPDFVLGAFNDQFIIGVPVEDRYGLFILNPQGFFN